MAGVSHCRITGASRALPKPHYFPLLPPISPADARRLCRVTGKAFNLPPHHYVPLLTTTGLSATVRCRVTAHAEGQPPHHFFPFWARPGGDISMDVPDDPFLLVHRLLDGFRYLLPVLDKGDSPGMTSLLDRLQQTEVERKDLFFAYALEESKCVLVLPADMEATLEKGDITSVHLAPEESVLALTLSGKVNTELSLNQMSKDKLKILVEERRLLEGHGPDPDVLARRAKAAKKRKRRQQDGLAASKTKLFEEKERQAEEAERKMSLRPPAKKLLKKIRRVVSREVDTEDLEDAEELPPQTPVEAKIIHVTVEAPALDEGHEITMREPPKTLLQPKLQVEVNFKAADTTVQDIIKPLDDWTEALERTVPNLLPPLETTSHLPKEMLLVTPVVVEPTKVDIQNLEQGLLLETPLFLQSYASLKSIAPPSTDITITKMEVQASTLEAISLLNSETHEVLQAALTASKSMATNREAVSVLLTASEMAKVIPQLVNLKDFGHLDLANGAEARFVASAESCQELCGAKINMEDGSVRFVPGQLVHTSSSETVFVPGQVVPGKHGPCFVAGLTLRSEEEETWKLLPGHVVTTSEGQTFEPGQVLTTENGVAFVAGQFLPSARGPVFTPGRTTTTTKDGSPGFVAGQVALSQTGPQFIPGQVLLTSQKQEFVPGATVDGAFIPGQMSNGQFVAGQTVATENGLQFVAGRTVPTQDGPQFVPGQTVITSSGEAVFVPGQTVDDGEKFVPGLTMTIDGEKQFVPGQIARTESGPVFVPGQTNPEEASFVPDHRVKMRSPPPCVPPTDSSVCVPLPTPAPVYGQLVQDESEVRFYKEEVMATPTMSQAIPGQLVRGPTGPKFVPGRMVAGKFVPGQVLDTEVGPRFVPGQVVDTAEGPKFVPGQIVVTEAGERFVPGQLLNTDDGPKFVPGQVLNTSRGPVFVPGQMVETEEGQRFVPGQVVETQEGQRFVPGHLEETPEGTRFVPGRVVVTSQGLRFLAPDVVSTPSGLQFSVQGFEVPPEEVSLCLEQPLCSPPFQPALDSNLLDKMAASGVALGRQVSAVLPALDFQAYGIEIDLDEEMEEFPEEPSKNLARSVSMDAKEVLRTVLGSLCPEVAASCEGDARTAVTKALDALLAATESSPERKEERGLQALVLAALADVIQEEEGTGPDKRSTILLDPRELQRKVLQRVESVTASDGEGLAGKVVGMLMTGSGSDYTVVGPQGERYFKPLGVLRALAANQGDEEENGTNGNDTQNGYAPPASPDDDSVLTDSGGSGYFAVVFPEGHELYEAVSDFQPKTGDEGVIPLQMGQLVEVLETSQTAKRQRMMEGDVEFDLGDETHDLLDSSAARHKMAIRPRRKQADIRQRGLVAEESASEEHRWLVRTLPSPTSPPQEGWVPASVLQKHRQSITAEERKTSRLEANADCSAKREAVVQELLETEEEFVRDLQYVVDNYYKHMDEPAFPRELRDHKELLFGNFKQISDFHSSVLIEGIKYYAHEPRMLGKTFLRLERDFDKHVSYCRDEPAAQELLQEDQPLREYMEEHSQQLGDDKTLSEHLKLPIQRVNDYQLLLKELVRFSAKLGEDTADLQRALELMLGVPQRASDLKFINSIEGYRGNIHKLGRLLRHNWFTVRDAKGHVRERYLFLFKARILVCKVRRISDDRSVFQLKDIIRLPEVEVSEPEGNPKAFQLHNQDLARYPLTLEAHSEDVRDAWLAEIRQYASDLVALAEHVADDLQIDVNAEEEPSEYVPAAVHTSEEEEEPEKPKEVLVPVQVEPRTPEVSEQQPIVSFPSTPDVSQHLGAEPTLAVVSVPATPEAEEVKVPAEVAEVKPEEELKVEQKKEVEKEVKEEEKKAAKEEPEVEEKKTSEPEPKPEPKAEAKKEEVKAEEAKPKAEKLTSKQKEQKAAAKMDDEEGKPRFEKTIVGTQCEVGEEANFVCYMASGVEDVTMTWLRDNRPLEDKLADRVTITSEPSTRRQSLRILNCRVEDTGLYTARASAPKGSATCSAPLIVQEVSEEERKRRAEANKPHFIVKLKDTELLEQTFARFMIKVVGKPLPKAKFLKDGQPLKEDERVWVNRDLAESGSYEIVIAGVTGADAGKYTCIAENSFGEEKSEGQVTMTDEKALFKALEGQRLLQPGEEPVFTWMRDGKPFSPEERFKVTFKDDEDTLALIFAHVKPEDAGLYTCVASTSSGNISCSAELTVQGAIHQLLREPEKPSIEAALTDTEVSVGGSAMMELKIKGYPKPNVKWYKDGKEVTAGGRFKFLFEDDESIALIIKGVLPEDGGKYKVVAKNDLGEASTEGTLLVRAPPKFKTKMKDMACMTDLPARINVEVEGTPAPEIKWYKDGQLLFESERIKFVRESAEKYTLIIERVTLEDAGNYSVVAANPIGQMADFWNLIANAPPRFLKEMSKEVTRGQGENFMYEVVVQGIPRPTIKWFKDGTELKHDGKKILIADNGEAIFTLTLKDISRTDAGRYSCRISNEFGESDDESTFRVTCPPLLKSQLKDVQVMEGATGVALSVDVEAHPKPKVRWYIDGVEITEKRKEFATSNDGCKLELKEVSEATSGKYSVRITNDLGEVESSATVLVKTKPKIIESPTSVEVDEGQSAKFALKCKATPEPQIKWYKNGAEVSADAHIKIKRENTETWWLEFDITIGEHSGSYEVKAVNEVGESSAKCELKVNTKPVITGGKMEDTEIWQSDTTIFEVIGSSVPSPEIHWYKGTKEVKESTSTLRISSNGDIYRMEIHEATLEETSVYKCTLKNRLGEVSKEANLTVKPLKDRKQPKIVVPPVDTQAKKGEPASFSAVVRGDPDPEVKWFRGQEELSTSQKIKISSDMTEHKFTIVLTTTHQDDTAIYTVKGFNSWGEGQASAKLDVLLKPEIDGMREVAVMPGGSSGFEVKIDSNPPAKVTWLLDKQEVKESERVQITTEGNIYRLTVFDAQLTEDGLYTVKASNEFGESSASARMSVRTEAPRFRTAPTDQKLRHRTPVRIMARLTGIPDPKLTWFKDGKPLELTESSRMKLEADMKHLTFELSTDGLEEEDCGQYLVRAANEIGEAEATCRLEMVQMAPSMKQGFDRTNRLDEGDILELKAKIDGSPVPQLSWFKDGKELVPNDRIRLSFDPNGEAKIVISDVKPEDAGAYRILAKNKHGETQTFGAVEVRERTKRPQIVQTPEPVKVKAGQPFKLEAKISGNPAPEVRWLKDGRALRASELVAMSILPDGTCTLEVHRAKVEDTGKYTLLLANSRGEAEVDTSVTVEAKKMPSLISPLKDQKVVEGTSLKLEAQLQGSPTPNLQWFKNGSPLSMDGRVTFYEGPDDTVGVSIANVGPDDAGEYRLVATNSEGETSGSANVSVGPRELAGEPQSPPSFDVPLRPVHVDEGKALLLTAGVKGNPLPDAAWSKDGKPLSPGGRNMLTFDGQKVALEIRPSMQEDAGRYTCQLSNPLGTAESSGDVAVRRVMESPVFVQPLKDIQQVPDTDIRLAVRVTGRPTPEVTWLRFGQPVPRLDRFQEKSDGEHHTLLLKSVKPDDAGEYACIARNPRGEAQTSAQLEIVDSLDGRERGEPPSFMKRLGDCEVYEGMPARFTACAAGRPDPDFEWFKDGVKVVPSERIKMERGDGLLRLLIARATDADVGQYKLRVFNAHGEATCEARLVFDTLELGAGKPISEQYVDGDLWKKGGAPLPLSERPFISRMTDRNLTLSWQPSVPAGTSRLPVTYMLEMCEMPDGAWSTVRSGIRSCVCDVGNLQPYRDYRFRIRVENKYGLSEPSPYVTTYRHKLELPSPTLRSHLEDGMPFLPDTSRFFPKDFDLERPPHDGFGYPPRFLLQEYPVQYGVKGQGANLVWFVYGYPKPELQFTFNGEKVEMGGRFAHSYTRSGMGTLFVTGMLDRDVGVYECTATNEHGEAKQKVQLEIAEHPAFITRLEESVCLARHSVRLEARVTGVPFPEIKWFKDWQPLGASSRVKMFVEEGDHAVLILSDTITRDEGLYSVSISNVAGSTSCSAMIRVEECEDEYAYRTYARGRDVKPKANRTFEDIYDIGEELGRGTQGITYHAAERDTGNNYAAKVMHGKGRLRPFMYNEMDMMNGLHHKNLIRLHDVFETRDSFTLVTELASGGEILDILTRQSHLTEYEVSCIIRQVLWGLEYMHSRGIAHLGLTPRDILLSHPGSEYIKICDFGLARRIHLGKLASLDYGQPEFVAPEVANGDGVGLPADMWSVGIITYLLLTGFSPYRGENDRETLTKIQSGEEVRYDLDIFSSLSADCKDFLMKIIRFQADSRLDVKTALRHPWLYLPERPPRDPVPLPTDHLKSYLTKLRDWYGNASCRRWFRRRPLSGAFTHPSRMVYPPGERYTPSASPSPPRQPSQPRRGWEENLPSREGLDYELGTPTSDSHYQQGPDTYLLQLRDVDFPVRLRRYMKVAARRSPALAIQLKEQPYDRTRSVIRERRRFTDVMDEEIEDERVRDRIHRYGTPEWDETDPDSGARRRIRREFGMRPETHVEAEAILADRKHGHPPILREKPASVAFKAGQKIELRCLAAGDKTPIVQWFRNDLVVPESNRVTVTTTEVPGGVCSIFRMDPAAEHDAGLYKVVARNSLGQSVSRFRILLGSIPEDPLPPEPTAVSDTEALVQWKPPRDDGGASVLCYQLQMKGLRETDWITLSEACPGNTYFVKGLQPNSHYHFRAAAYNRFGWGPRTEPGPTARTLEAGAAKLSLTPTQQILQEVAEKATEPPVDPAANVTLESDLDFSVETNCINMEEKSPQDYLKFVQVVHKGHYGVVACCSRASDSLRVAAKVVPLGGSDEEEEDRLWKREWDALRHMRHERLCCMVAAFKCQGALVMVNQWADPGTCILSYFASKDTYSEAQVTAVAFQVLEALNYLHWRGYAHLDVQPDNVIVSCAGKGLQVKLTDLGSAQKVSRLGSKVYRVGNIDYASPEVVSDDPAYPQSDVWSVGCLVYLLLSGIPPFRGADENETRLNVVFVRFRFEHIFPGVSQEANRFLLLVFKRAPGKRPSAEDCLEHRWLQPSDYVQRKKERTTFQGSSLQKYSDEYHSAAQGNAMGKVEEFLRLLGGH